MNEMIKESGTSARLPWPRITFALFVATMWLATVAKQARAQTIIINPICGAAGSSVTSHIPITSVLKIYVMENTTSAAGNVTPLPRLPGSQLRSTE